MEEKKAPLENENEQNEKTTPEEQLRWRMDNMELSFVDEYKDNPYNNVFVESLENVTADDLGEEKPKEKRDPVDVIIGGIRNLIFWVAIAAFFISGYQIVYKLYSYKQAADIYRDVAARVFDNKQTRDDLVKTSVRGKKLAAMAPVNGTRAASDIAYEDDPAAEYNEAFEMMKGQLTIIQRKNPEVVGWINMEGTTEINYPVVQHEDNDYYLHYAYDGAYNPAGSIFLDCKNQTTLSKNRHTIIYGHNMESGSPMFANLLHYQEAGYLDKNRYVDIYTKEALYTYEVFASYRCGDSLVNNENNAWRMNFNRDDAVFLGWIDAIRARSDITSDIVINANDRILTLSTCTNANNDRYVVHAVLIKTVK